MRERLHALATVVGQPQWRVLSDAVNTYVDRLATDERQLVLKMVKQSEKILMQPARNANGHEATRGATILNVDDNEAMLFARSTLLRREGFEVVEAHNGNKALQLLESYSPNVVLLDVHLPDMNGLDICRQIKADPKHRHVKVIQISATFNTPRDQLHGLEHGGADIYLAEPVQRGTLLSVIRRLLTV